MRYGIIEIVCKNCRSSNAMVVPNKDLMKEECVFCNRRLVRYYKLKSNFKGNKKESTIIGLYEKTYLKQPDFKEVRK